MDLQPTSTAEVAAIVGDAAGAGRTLGVIGTGTRRGIGRPMVVDAVLSIAGLSGIVDYDPGELVLTARAGTPLAEIAAAVAAAGQHLAFEPPDMAPLWGGAAGAGTLGGMLGVGWGGSRRPWAGAPRDHFLGFTAVNGMGEVFAAGGKVIKNVTGYDLPKLMAGSFGTLAVLTEVTIKTLPKPRATATVVVDGLDDAAAVAAMTRALASRVGVTGAAHLPAAVAGALDATAVASASTRVRVDGAPQTIRGRASEIAALLADFGPARIVEEDDLNHWRDIGAGHSLLGRNAAVWRVSLPPSAAAAYVARLEDVLSYYYDWGGGLVWLAVANVGDAGAGIVRGALPPDGHATLVRADADIRATVAPFQPLADGLAALEERVRQRFDRNAVLNPGRRVKR